ncbi:MAG: outer membrane lipoprotein chaperone LolA [Deltaproteobacteria bacterium]|nr:outer membrane lipoprotein chaperone LolA [Deltaproteobacteria bacterium]
MGGRTVNIQAMKRTTTIVVFLLTIAGLTAALAKDEPGDLLDRVQAFYEASKDYKASFRQVVTTRSPRRAFTRKGTVYFKRPGMMRWDYKVPDEVYYVSDGKVLWSYEVEQAVAYRLEIGDSNLFHALKFLTGTGKLTQDFNAHIGEPLESGLIPVKLLPRESERSFKSVTLLVDPATGETRETEVVDPLGNVSHLWFESPSYQDLPADRFTFHPPDGIRVQEVGPR